MVQFLINSRYLARLLVMEVVALMVVRVLYNWHDRLLRVMAANLEHGHFCFKWLYRVAPCDKTRGQSPTSENAQYCIKTMFICTKYSVARYMGPRQSAMTEKNTLRSDRHSYVTCSRAPTAPPPPVFLFARFPFGSLADQMQDLHGVLLGRDLAEEVAAGCLAEAVGDLEDAR